MSTWSTRHGHRPDPSPHRLWRRMRWLVWGGAAFLLLLPWVGMRFSPQVQWSGADFAVMALLLGAVCVVFEVAVRVGRSHAYVLGAGTAAGTAFLTVWTQLAVGIIGDGDHPANLMFAGVLLLALAGVAWSRLDPGGLARAMGVTAAAQGVAAMATFGLAGPREGVFTAALAAMWLLSATWFHRAARRGTA